MYPKMVTLNQDHWDEVGGIAGQCELDIDFNMYLTLQSQGILIMVAAYDDDKLVGYVSCSRAPHPHHKGKIFASTDAFYVAPKYRGITGTKLIKFTEALLRDRHSVDYFSIIANTNFRIDSWANRMGYQESDIVYTKKLEE